MNIKERDRINKEARKAREDRAEEMLSDQSKQPRLRDMDTDEITELAANVLLFIGQKFSIDCVFLQAIIENSDSGELYEVLTHS